MICIPSFLNRVCKYAILLVKFLASLASSEIEKCVGGGGSKIGSAVGKILIDKQTKLTFFIYNMNQ